MWLHSLSGPQRHALFDLAHNVIVSDGLLDPNEERMMDQFRREMGISDAVESAYIDLDGIDDVFDSRHARLVALINLLHLSYADGAFEIEEECFLRELSRVFGIADNEFLLLDNWVRRLRAMEQEIEALV